MYMSQHMRFWHVSSCRRTKTRVSHSPEPSLISLKSNDVDKALYQVFDIYLRWIHKHGCLKDAISNKISRVGTYTMEIT